MSTYELDDDLVRKFVRIHTTAGGPAIDDAGELATALEAQMPIPVPTKIGAVVRTGRGTFVRADGSITPWILARMPGAAFVERPDWLADDSIGRIVEVLSEGVDV